MSNSKHLIPAKPGEVRNPKGKPKGTLNHATIFKRFASVIEKTKNGITGQNEELTQEEQIVIANILEAKAGNMQAIKEIYDRLYGKVPDRIIDETPPKKLVMIVTDDDID